MRKWLISFEVLEYNNHKCLKHSTLQTTLISISNVSPTFNSLNSAHAALTETKKKKYWIFFGTCCFANF